MRLDEIFYNHFEQLIESLPVGFSYPMQANFQRIFSIIIVIFKLIFQTF